MQGLPGAQAPAGGRPSSCGCGGWAVQSGATGKCTATSPSLLGRPPGCLHALQRADLTCIRASHLISVVHNPAGPPPGAGRGRRAAASPGARAVCERHPGLPAHRPAGATSLPRCCLRHGRGAGGCRSSGGRVAPHSRPRPCSAACICGRWAWRPWCSPGQCTRRRGASPCRCFAISSVSPSAGLAGGFVLGSKQQLGGRTRGHGGQRRAAAAARLPRLGALQSRLFPALRAVLWRQRGGCSTRACRTASLLPASRRASTPPSAPSAAPCGLPLCARQRTLR